MGHRLLQRRHQGPRFSCHKEGQVRRGPPNTCERRDVLSHLHHPIARELPEPYWTMLLSANAGRDFTPRNQPHARVESQTFRNVSTRIASHYLLTYNPMAFVYTTQRTSKVRRPCRECTLDHLPYSDHQHERRISPMRFGVCSCHPFCLVSLRLLNQFCTFIRGLGLCSQ